MAEGARRAAAKEEQDSNTTSPPAAKNSAHVLVNKKKGVAHQTQADVPVYKTHTSVPLRPSPRPPTKPLSLAGTCTCTFDKPYKCCSLFLLAMETRTAMIAQRKQAREERRKKLAQEKEVHTHVYMYVYMYMCGHHCTLYAL